MLWGKERKSTHPPSRGCARISTPPPLHLPPQPPSKPFLLPLPSTVSILLSVLGTSASSLLSVQTRPLAPAQLLKSASIRKRETQGANMRRTAERKQRIDKVLMEGIGEEKGQKGGCTEKRHGGERYGGLLWSPLLFLCLGHQPRAPHLSYDTAGSVQNQTWPCSAHPRWKQRLTFCISSCTSWVRFRADFSRSSIRCTGKASSGGIMVHTQCPLASTTPVLFTGCVLTF